MVLPDARRAPAGYVPQPGRGGTARPYTPGAGGSLGASTTQLATPGALPAAGGGGTLPGGGALPGGGFPSEAEMLAALNSPEYAIAAIRRAKTGGKRDLSALGDYREGLLGQALQAYLALIMPNSDKSYVGDPLAQAQQGLAGIAAGATNGQGFGGLIRQQGLNALGQDFSGMKDDDIYQILAAAEAAGEFGYGKLGSLGLQNALAGIQNLKDQSAMAGDPTGVLGQPGALDTFKALLQRYLGTK
jgi:hypothetical protein